MAAERGFAVRRAAREDAADFVRQRAELVGDAGLSGLTQAKFLQGLEAGTLLVWLARDAAGELVGSVAMHLFSRLPSPASPTGEEGYVVHAYVRPESRRRGVGSALMQALLAESRRLGLSRLRLHSTPEGRGLYLRCGFSEYAGNMQLRLG